jgi:hypothetical protein
VSRFSDGDQGVCVDAGGNAIRWRIVGGGKRRRAAGEQQGDLVIEILSNGIWVRPTCEFLFLLVDFLCENEDRLYKTARPRTGGDYLMRYLWAAKVHGWRHAWAQVREEKRVSRAWRDSPSAWELLPREDRTPVPY